MRATTKAGLLIAITFALGGVTGLLGGGAWRQRQERSRPRPESPPADGGRRGFVAQTLDLLEPRDSAQREALLPFVVQADGRNREIVGGAREGMRAELDSLRARIAPLLSPAQLERFDEFRRRSTGGCRCSERKGSGADRSSG